MPNQRICRLPEVIARTGLPRSTIYELMLNDEFPSQIRLGRRTVGWVESEIEVWIDRRIDVSRRNKIESR
ncbi:MAG: AlpA family transcriptional regulator [Gammaproteobacteria bacterium]|nr:AlpA family transcriptional regulator [Gammaproteobacteria bacterium]MDH5303970.1 AlpA family transcriptional regulator [Gammaproteobacteria bacterium]